MTRALRATVSGSFNRFIAEVGEAVIELRGLGVQVLSPEDPIVVGAVGDFLFVASDPVHCLKLVQDRHLAAIAASDFVWLVNPGGYVGVSAAMEIGYATRSGVPVFSTTLPRDTTIREYVTKVSALAGVAHALKRHRQTAAKVRTGSLAWNVAVS